MDTYFQLCFGMWIFKKEKCWLVCSSASVTMLYHLFLYVGVDCIVCSVHSTYLHSIFHIHLKMATGSSMYLN